MTISTLSVPCYTCRERSPRCHGRCPAYQAFDATNRQRRKEHLLAMEADGMDVTRTRRAWLAMRNGRKAKEQV